MTSVGPSGRVSKRHNRAKIVVDVELSLSTEHSGCVHPRVRRGTSVSISSQRIPTTEQQQGSAHPLCDSSNDLVIDLEAIDDEVQMLSSSRGFPPARDRSRRNRPVTVILDEELDTNSRRSGVSVELPSKRATINCELYPDSKEGKNAKGKNVMKSKSAQATEEPTFSCPVCMSTLVEASSTICGHIFCKSCITTSIKTQKKCPTCRKKLSLSQFHRVFFPTFA
ncbi:hypothetical protein Cni_G26743 [Canna indica]|uniref:RING-type domain-containing protein n=1 Tax=Canna indica TaxID=4628 RepID=A0AAQ3L094_9LILI|nr:hypothetical protein Cni_G26743 [Canna indica]